MTTPNGRKNSEFRTAHLGHIQGMTKKDADWKNHRRSLKKNAPKKQVNELKSSVTTKSYDEGYKAYRDGVEIFDNPYNEINQEASYYDWQDGWEDAETETRYETFESETVGERGGVKKFIANHTILNKPYKEGRAAAKEGIPSTSNPYPRDMNKLARQSWFDGWIEVDSKGAKNESLESKSSDKESRFREYKQGWNAYGAGESNRSNPYSERNQPFEWYSWREGWESARTSNPLDGVTDFQPEDWMTDPLDEDDDRWKRVAGMHTNKNTPEREAGFDAGYIDGAKRNANPYEVMTVEYDDWDHGWEEAQIKLHGKGYMNEDRSPIRTVAFDKGWSAYERGKNTDDNPYDKGTRQHTEWRSGWYGAINQEPSGMYENLSDELAGYGHDLATQRKIKNALRAGRKAYIDGKSLDDDNPYQSAGHEEQWFYHDWWREGWLNAQEAHEIARGSNVNEDVARRQTLVGINEANAIGKRLKHAGLNQMGKIVGITDEDTAGYPTTFAFELDNGKIIKTSYEYMRHGTAVEDDDGYPYVAVKSRYDLNQFLDKAGAKAYLKNQPSDANPFKHNPKKHSPKAPDDYSRWEANWLGAKAAMQGEPKENNPYERFVDGRHPNWREGWEYATAQSSTNEGKNMKNDLSRLQKLAGLTITENANDDTDAFYNIIDSQSGEDVTGMRVRHEGLDQMGVILAVTDEDMYGLPAEFKFKADNGQEIITSFDYLATGENYEEGLGDDDFDTSGPDHEEVPITGAKAYLQGASKDDVPSNFSSYGITGWNDGWDGAEAYASGKSKDDNPHMRYRDLGGAKKVFNDRWSNWNLGWEYAAGNTNEGINEWANSVNQNWDDRGWVTEQPPGETVDLSLRRYLNATPKKVKVEEDIKAKDLLREYYRQQMNEGAEDIATIKDFGNYVMKVKDKIVLNRPLKTAGPGTKFNDKATAIAAWVTYLAPFIKDDKLAVHMMRTADAAFDVDDDQILKIAITALNVIRKNAKYPGSKNESTELNENESKKELRRKITRIEQKLEYSQVAGEERKKLADELKSLYAKFKVANESTDQKDLKTHSVKDYNDLGFVGESDDEVVNESDMKKFKVTYKTKAGKESTCTIKARNEKEALAQCRRKPNYAGNSFASELKESTGRGHPTLNPEQQKIDAMKNRLKYWTNKGNSDMIRIHQNKLDKLQAGKVTESTENKSDILTEDTKKNHDLSRLQKLAGINGKGK